MKRPSKPKSEGRPNDPIENIKIAGPKGSQLVDLPLECDLSACLEAVSDGCDDAVWKQHIERCKATCAKGGIIDQGFAWNDGITLRTAPRNAFKFSKLPKGSRFMPMLMRLEGVEWKPVPRLAVLAQRILGCTEPSLASALEGDAQAGVKVLITEVRQIHEHALQQVADLQETADKAYLEECSKTLQSTPMTQQEWMNQIMSLSVNAGPENLTALTDAPEVLPTYRQGVALKLSHICATLVDLLRTTPPDDPSIIAIQSAFAVGQSSILLQILSQPEIVERFRVSSIAHRKPSPIREVTEDAWLRLAQQTRKRPKPKEVAAYLRAQRLAKPLPDLKKCPEAMHFPIYRETMSWGAFKECCQEIHRARW